MKQTAVEWFYQRILSKDIKQVFEQAKAMEKEQIIQAYHKSALNEATHIVAGTSHISAEQYYNQTYGKNAAE